MFVFTRTAYIREWMFFVVGTGSLFSVDYPPPICPTKPNLSLLHTNWLMCGFV